MAAFCKKKQAPCDIFQYVFTITNPPQS